MITTGHVISRRHAMVAIGHMIATGHIITMIVIVRRHVIETGHVIAMVLVVTGDVVATGHVIAMIVIARVHHHCILPLFWVKDNPTVVH